MKTTRTILVIALIIILLPFFGYFLWLLQKNHPLDLMIVNKSVSSVKSNEFKAFNWVLNYRKVTKSTGSDYDYTRDYYGFYPEPIYRDDYLKSYRLDEIPGLTEQYDGLVFLDNQGVNPTLSAKAKISSYGGFNQNDYVLLKEMVSRDKLIIAENNFFSEPTEDLVRFNTEQLLDVYSLHWKGKLFQNLSLRKVEKEIGKSWIETYKQYYGKDWAFEGPGLIILNEKQSRILVLPSKEYMNSEFPAIITSGEIAALYKLPESVPYDGWFQIVYEGKNQVISKFDLMLNDQGKERLKTSGLDFSFPAVIALAKQNQYFLAGDFSKQNVMLLCSKSRFLSGTASGLCRIVSGNPGQFFQNYYVPLMSSIIDQYIHSTEASGKEL